MPQDERYWALIRYTPKWSFEAAARKAMAEEGVDRNFRGLAAKLEEAVVQLVLPKLRR